MNPSKEVLSKLLEEERYVKAREGMVRYLAAYRVIEKNLALFDKLARCRDPSDFIGAIYEGMRVKERVLDKIVEGVKGGEIKVVFEYKDPSELARIFDVGQEHINALAELAREDPRIVGTLIASMALAYGGIYEVRR